MISENVYESGTPSEGNIVIYLRVSTKKQGITGNGIAAQRQQCLNHLNGGNWRLVGEFTEQESGKKNNRPELEKALQQCIKDDATLVIAKLDRLARNVHFVSRLLESGINFVCADMPHANKLTIHIIAAMAEYESDQTSKRTKAALAIVKGRGKKLGSKDIVRLAEDGRAARTASAQLHAENVYPVIERIRSFGITTYREIAGELTDRKIETPARQAKIDKNKPPFGAPKWHPQQVKAIVDRIEGEE